MKSHLIHLSRFILAASVLSAAALSLPGCGSDNEPAVNTASSPDIAGEPIVGEPIQTAEERDSGRSKDKPGDDSNLAVVVAGAESVVEKKTDVKNPPEAFETAPAERPKGVKAKDSKHTRIDFDFLASFEYDIPEDPVSTNQVVEAMSADQIPEKVKAFDRKPVSLTGFMLPLKVEDGLVTELLIMRDQSMCCFGTVPKITEWVSVKMIEEGVKPIMDEPVTLLGKLRVGEVLENGYLVGIYEMEGERMIGPAEM